MTSETSPVSAKQDLPEFDHPLGSDEEFYDDEELEDFIKQDDVDEVKDSQSIKPAGSGKDTESRANKPEPFQRRSITTAPKPVPRKRCLLLHQDRVQEDRPEEDGESQKPFPVVPGSRVNPQYFSSTRSNTSSVFSNRSRFEPTPIDQITMQPPSVPLVSVMTWDDRQKKLLEQEAPPAESFSRGNSFRMGMRRSKREPRIRKPELPVPPEVSELENKSPSSPLSGSEPSSMSSPSLMSSSSTNPKAIDQLPAHGRPEELRLDLSGLKSDSEATRSSMSDFKSLETSMEPSLESSYL
jgi:hypothetical protein